MDGSWFVSQPVDSTPSPGRTIAVGRVSTDWTDSPFDGIEPMQVPFHTTRARHPTVDELITCRRSEDSISVFVDRPSCESVIGA